MVPLEALGWFMLGAGVTSLAVGLFHLVNIIMIIIDHDLPDLTLPDREKFKEMVLKGEAGRINEVPEKAMEKVKEFIFSPQALRDMRRAGMEPDEVVTKMLKASGRME